MILTQTLLKVKEYFLYSIILILIIISLLFGIKSCEKSKQINGLQNQLVDVRYNDSMSFKQKHLKDSTIEITQAKLLDNKDDATVKQIEKQNDVIHLKSEVVFVTKLVYVHDTLHFSDSTKLVKLIDTTNGKIDSFEALPLPAMITHIDSNIQIQETITTEGATIDYLVIPNTTTITIADEKKTLFNATPIVKIHFSNPNVSTLNVKNIVVKPKVSKPIKTFLIGGGIGIGVGAILTGLFYHYVK